MVKFKKIMMIIAIVLVSLFVVGLCVSLFVPLGNSSTNNDSEKQPVYNIWQFPEEEKINNGLTMLYTDNYTLGTESGYFLSNDKITNDSVLSKNVASINSTQGGIAFSSTFYNVLTTGYDGGYPNLEVSTVDNCYLLNFGVRFKVNNLGYQIFFRYYSGSVDKYSIDIIRSGKRYRYVTDKVADLYDDFKSCGYVKFEFGQELINKNEFLFGFSFSTENVKVSFDTLNTGDIKLDDRLYYCAISSTHTEEYMTVRDMFNAFNGCTVENFTQDGFQIMSNGGYDFYGSTEYSDYNVFVTAKKGSTYFEDLYWSYRNNVESVIDKYVPQI